MGRYRFNTFQLRLDATHAEVNGKALGLQGSRIRGRMFLQTPALGAADGPKDDENGAQRGKPFRKLAKPTSARRTAGEQHPGGHRMSNPSFHHTSQLLEEPGGLS